MLSASYSALLCLLSLATAQTIGAATASGGNLNVNGMPIEFLGASNFSFILPNTSPSLTVNVTVIKEQPLAPTTVLALLDQFGTKSEQQIPTENLPTYQQDNFTTTVNGTTIQARSALDRSYTYEQLNTTLTSFLPGLTRRGLWYELYWVVNISPETGKNPLSFPIVGGGRVYKS